jgi:hypothetical protein
MHELHVPVVAFPSDAISVPQSVQIATLRGGIAGTSASGGGPMMITAIPPVPSRLRVAPADASITTIVGLAALLTRASIAVAF